MKYFKFYHLICFIVFALVSCDHYLEQHFYIHNELDSAVLIHFDYGDRIDSTATVANHSTKEICSYGGVFGNAGVKDERYNDGVKNLKIETNDTIINLNESLWYFQKENKHYANSTIRIDSTMLH